MVTQDYHKDITTTASAEEAFTKISDVRAWWTPNIKGSGRNLNDVFTMWADERTIVHLQVGEAVQNKKWVWLVTDCQLLWLKDATEWKGTQIVFEISEEGHQTRVGMTHIGLLPEVECYDVCYDGWNRHLKDLATWIETGISPLT